jgi:uncharacterized protein (UPF0335 family)
MKDIYREYIMGHALKVKSHYFDWDLMKRDVILQYLKCNFNRMAIDVSKEITALKENGVSKDEKIKRLEKDLEYLKSPQFTKDIMAEIKGNSFEIPEPKNVVTKVIDIGDKESWQRLTKQGFYLIESDDEHFILQKEEE